MRSLCAKVPKEKGEHFRKLLTEAQLIDHKLMIKHNDRFLYIPLESHPDKVKIHQHQYTWLKEIELIEDNTLDFKSYPDQNKDYKSLR